MATQTLINPFSMRCGTAVPTELYVSRPVEETIITERVLGSYFNNLSIVGLPKTGKSTIVSHCIIEKAEQLAKDKTMVVYYQMGSTRSSLDFYKKIAKKFDGCFSLNYPDDQKYNSFVHPLVEEIRKTDCIEDITELLEDYFRRGRHIGYKHILVLDEFDHAHDILTFEDFQFLREISYMPKDKICLVTCSRKPLNDIEKKAPDDKLSVFAQTFKTCPIGMYEEQNLIDYWVQSANFWEVKDSNKSFVKYVAGNNPWLMDVVNDFLFEHQDITDISDMLSGVKASLMEGYDHLINILNSESLLNPSIQLVVGPLFDANPVQIEKLLKYGFLKTVTPQEKKAIYNGIELGPVVDTNSYVCFSDYCSWDFYRRYYANIPYAQIWSETENELRNLVKIYLSERYSTDWETEMQQNLTNNLPYRGFNVANWTSNVQRLKTNMNDMIARFPTMSGNHIVDFTLTSQIFNIFIKWDWTWFGNVFKGQKMEWHSKFDHLTNVRDPIAHSNPGDIKSEMELARTYCSEIKNSIIAWKKTRSV